MRRLVVPAAALALGIGVGAFVVTVRSPAPTASGPPSPPSPASVPARPDISDASTTRITTAITGGATTTTTGAPTTARPSVLLAWAPQPVAAPVVEALARDPATAALTAVRRDDIGLVGAQLAGAPQLDARDGFQIPVDVMAFDPATYAPFVPQAQADRFTHLAPGEALLGATGARVRKSGIGTRLTFAGGGSVMVVGVVDDELVGAAEVAVTDATGRTIGVDQVRYLLQSYRGTRAEAEAAVTRLLPGPIRFRGPGETPWLRNADAVLPLALVKAQFGEFGYRVTRDGFEQLPLWTAGNIVSATVPVLGTVRCHRAIIDALAGAMRQLQQEQLGHLVDPAMSEVCWRLGRIHDEHRLSRQAWGIGLQLNNARNPTGSGSVQDRRLIEIMRSYGFTWGGDWLIAEPSYFEFVGPPPSSP